MLHAFARPYSEEKSGDYPRDAESQEGMTLRDYFAAAALPGIIAADLGLSYQGLARRAYFIADAMIAERDK